MFNELKEIVLNLGLVIENEQTKTYKEGNRELTIYIIESHNTTIVGFSSGHYIIKHVHNYKIHTWRTTKINSVKAILTDIQKPNCEYNKAGII